MFRFHGRLLLLAVLASSYFLADLRNGLERICLRVFGNHWRLALMLETKHIFYERIGPLYHVLSMFLFHDDSFSVHGRIRISAYVVCA
jgi:hypothetical protein